MPASPLLLTSTALRRIETDAAATLPPGSLMDRAARSAAARIATSWPSGAVVVLCGPGNNGGDGLVLARMLHEAGRHVKVWALPAAEAGRPADAQRAWDALPAGLLQTGEPVWPAGSAAADAAHAADGSGGSARGDDGPGADEERGAMGAAVVDADAPDAVDATAGDVTPTEVTPTEVIPADVTAEDVTGEDVTAADVPAEDVAATYVAAENLSADDVTGEILSDDDLSEEPLSTGALFDAPLLDQGRITDGLLLDGDAPRGVIVDALFGIGLTRPLDAQARAWVAWANAQPVARLAMDVPSGLDADTGAAQDVCVQATHTLTFIADKPGLHTRAGSDVAGTIEVDDLQLSVFVDAAADASASPEAGSYGGSNAEARPDVTDRATHHVGRPANPIGHLIRKADCASLFQTRKHDTHKGSYGTLAVLAGATGMTGAALLASRAALLTGAGKIFVALADTPPLSLPCDPVHPELMVRDATGVLDAADALGIGTWVAGCGLGTHDAARGWLTRVLRERPDANVVLDADALTLLAADPGLQTLFRQRQGVKVLTPHPLEAARLLGGDTHAVQADRIAAACAIASRFGAWVVLKGAGTVVSSPAGAWRVNTSGNPGLATAGTGDVLSGMLGALVAQGLPPEDAIGGGVWLHGAAADRLVEQGIGPIGLTASDVADAARWIRNHG